MESSLSHSFSQLKRKFNSGDYNEYDIERKRQQRFDMADPIAVEPLTVTMECPSASVGAIIGKKGANVNEIMNRSGCRIVIDQSDQREGVPKRVNLTGPPDRLAIAMSLVSLIIKDGANALFGVGENEDFDGPVVSLTSETRCPTVKVGSIIGARGATIAEITRRSGCKVHIIQDPPSDGNVNERQVIYSGTLDQMAEAKSLVLIVIADGPTALGLPELKPQENAHKGQQQHLYPLKSAVSALVVQDDVDPEKVGTIIGSKGYIISEIMRKSGCKVIINQDFPLGIPHKVVYSGIHLFYSMMCLSYTSLLKCIIVLYII
jgi:rRNA processing protein Krr1/Pno1